VSTLVLFNLLVRSASRVADLMTGIPDEITVHSEREEYDNPFVAGYEPILHSRKRSRDIQNSYDLNAVLFFIFLSITIALELNQNYNYGRYPKWNPLHPRVW
jgi:hypothetical protein